MDFRIQLGWHYLGHSFIEQCNNRRLGGKKNLYSVNPEHAQLSNKLEYSRGITLIPPIPIYAIFEVDGCQ